MNSTSSRLADCFGALSGRAALIPYLTAGDPLAGPTPELMHAMVRAGADIIELGVPFSDPMADGPTIQQAGERAIAGGTNLAAVLEMVAEFRQKDDHTPVVLMGYANPVENMGPEIFVQHAQQAGVDGALVVDYTPEESADFARSLQQHGIAPIYLLAPTSGEDRIKKVAQLAQGYVYYVSLKGVTGAATIDTADVARHIDQIRQHVKIPIAVGFGIRDAASASAIGACADAVVIGSRLIGILAEESRRAGPQAAVRVAAEWLAEIRQALEQSKRHA